MAAKNTDAFKTFTAGVLNLISDPEQKRKAEEAIATLTTIDPAAAAFGDGVLAHSELSRQLDQLRTEREQLQARETEISTYHDQLNGWYQNNQGAVAYAREHGYKPGGGNGDPKPKTPAVTPPASGLSKEEVEQQLSAAIINERAGFLGFTRDQNEILRDHYSKFGEIVAIDPLLTHPKIAELGLKGVYALVHKDRLEKHATDAAAAAEEKIRADERAKVQASMAQMPYPSPTGAGSGSPLDALTPAGKDNLVDAATAHYNRLQQERMARGGSPA